MIVKKKIPSLNARLQQDKHDKETKRTKEVIRREHQNLITLNAILSISIKPYSLKEMLDHILKQIVSVPWLTLESKGAIFMVEDELDMLIMKSSQELPQSIHTMCSRVPFGKCLCGQAASTKKIQFAYPNSDCHENRDENISPHCHYCIPILSSNQVLGVLSLFVTEGHQHIKRSKEEENFLHAIADMLAGIIERKKAEDTLRERDEELRTKTNNLERANTALSVLLRKRDEDKTACEEKVMSNVKELILPYLEKLKKSELGNMYSDDLNMIESNLNDIISSFSLKLSSKYLNLTSTEIKIANLIK
jgi:transcriptional regulator with GAF, ATPase, and Fis domain